MLDQQKRYYVYAWYTKDTNEIFYIGKGTGKRYLTRKRENKFFMNVLNAHDSDSFILKDGLSEKEAFDLEIILIEYYRKKSRILTNICDGGENPPKMYGKRPEEWGEKIKKGVISAYKKNPELRKKSSDRMKAFLQTEKGKDFIKKSVQSRNNDKFRKEQSIRCKKANNTKEYKDKQSKIMKEIYSSEEIRERWRGGKNPRAQSVKQFDLNKNFIKEYDTITQASKETGVGIARISDVARGNRKTAGGFIWSFSNDKKIKNNGKHVYQAEKDKSRKPIIQYNLDGTFVKEYGGIAEAARKNDLDRTNIISNLKGRTKTAYGYIWKYK